MSSFPCFIALEGLDGSGKDTCLLKLLPLFFDENLRSPLFISKYQNVLRTREPTLLTPVGRQVREKLENGTLAELPARKVSSLYIEDRKGHSKQIREYLKQDTIVLSSRYDLSTYAYQMAMGEDFHWIYAAHAYQEEEGSLIPDITLYFRLNVEIAWQRITARGGKKEALEDRQLLEKTSLYYDECAKLLQAKDKRKVITIDAENSAESVFQEVVEKLIPYFKR